jgi:hypothetical protein
MLLKKTAFFLRGAVTEFDQESAFAYGSDVTVARPKLTGDAEDYNPRSLVPALSQEVDYVRTTLKLDKLFTKGIPVYATDASQKRYVNDFGHTSSDSIRRSIEKYLYEVGFRSYLVPPTGVYRYGANSPVQVAWNENAAGVLQPFARNLLVRASSILQREEVPASDLYAAVSPDAIGDMLLASPTEEGLSGAYAGGAGVLTYGLPEGAYLLRHGFKVGSSTTTSGQPGVANLSAGAPSVTIASAAADTTLLLQDDQAALTPLGAVVITASAAFATPLGAGQIVRIGVTGVTAIAYGVVLRAGASSVTLVPYGRRGEVVPAAQITDAIASGVRISAPTIASINPAYHKEHLLFASRKLMEPGQGDGATCTTVADAGAGLILQLTKGSYDVDRFASSARMSFLTGAVATDHRKAVLMLCA